MLCAEEAIEKKDDLLVIEYPLKAVTSSTVYTFCIVALFYVAIYKT